MSTWESLNLTIEALAAGADMHTTYLSGIERGRYNPSWDKLWALADQLALQALRPRRRRRSRWR